MAVFLYKNKNNTPAMIPKIAIIPDISAGILILAEVSIILLSYL
jgi:hypothetical protein